MSSTNPGASGSHLALGRPTPIYENCLERECLLKQLAEKLGLRLLLGGAAVYRCDNRLVFSVGFSRCGDTSSRKTLFPQPVKRCPDTKPSANSQGVYGAGEALANIPLGPKTTVLTSPYCPLVSSLLPSYRKSTPPAFPVLTRICFCPRTVRSLPAGKSSDGIALPSAVIETHDSSRACMTTVKSPAAGAVELVGDEFANPAAPDPVVPDPVAPEATLSPAPAAVPELVPDSPLPRCDAGNCAPVVVGVGGGGGTGCECSR
jgi:hypothetical protein